MPALPPFFVVDPGVARAMEQRQPVVALESTVITHGLPFPQNLDLAKSMEAEVLQLHATPATIAVLDGRVRVGLKASQLERLARAAASAAGPKPSKLSARDLGPAIALRQSGGTTVAGTLAVAAQAGIEVFATGGIGGVHRNAPFDVSADLPQLGHSPLVVVCAGAKSILDLPATLEMLETLGVAVIGYQTDDFPAFFSTKSGLKVTHRAETPKQIAAMARAHWALGLKSAVLVVNPPPAGSAIPSEEMEAVIAEALAEAEAQEISGQAVTPFLLARVNALSHGRSLQANLALLHNNARLAAQIAAHLGSAHNDFQATAAG